MTGTLQDYWLSLRKLRCPVGLMLFKAEQYESVTEIAARSGATLVDFREAALASVPVGGRYVDFRPTSLFALLRAAHDASQSRQLIVKNFDLGLARMKTDDRARFWETLVNNFPANSNTALVIAMPDEQTASHLLPPIETLKRWIDLKRAFRIPSA
jgi:hypothetical protein